MLTVFRLSSSSLLFRLSLLANAAHRRNLTSDSYGTFAVISFVGGVVFWFTFSKLDKEEDSLNEIKEGRRMDAGEPKQVV